LLNDLCGLNDDTNVILAAPDIILNPLVTESHFHNRFKLDSLLEVCNLEALNLKYKPRVNFYGNMGINAIELPNIQRKAGMGLGISVIVPIYDGHQKNLNLSESNINLKIIDNYKQNFLTIKSNRQKAIISELRSTDERIEMIKTQLHNYEELIELYTAKLRTGEIKIIDFMNIIKSYISAKHDLTINETNRFLL